MRTLDDLPKPDRNWLWKRRNWLSVPPLPADVLQAASAIEQTEKRLEALAGGRIVALEAEALASSVRDSWAVEGVELDPVAIRSSILKRLGLDVPEWKAYAARRSAGEDIAVRATLDMLNGKTEVTLESILAVHGKLAPPASEAAWGRFRTSEEYVVKGFGDRREIVYVAPPPEDVPGLMRKYVRFWHESLPGIPRAAGAALAHLFLVVIHPFEDGNGRMGRLLADKCMARGQAGTFRPYSVSSVFRAHGQAYAARLDGLDRRDGVERFLRFALARHEEAARAAEARAEALAGLEGFFAAAPFLTDEQRHIVRVMAMDPGRKWICDDVVFDMEDDEAACAAWDDLVGRGYIRQGRLHLEAVPAPDRKPHGCIISIGSRAIQP